MRFAQSADTIIFVYEDLEPLKLVRGAKQTLTGQNPHIIHELPRHAFTIATSNPAANITPDGTQGNIKVTASSGVFASSNEGQYINVLSTWPFTHR